MNYQKHYDLLIIKRGFVVKPSWYSERHHILPRCMGGTDNASNLRYLTAKEHFIAHVLLARANPKHYGVNQAAFQMSTYAGNKICSATYEILRKIHAESVSKMFTGVPKSEAHVKTMSESRKGVVPWGATNAAAISNKGSKRPNISAALSGKNNYNYGSGVCLIPMEARLKGLSKVTVESKSLRAKGKLWWTNGTRDVRSKEQPEGFNRGRSRYAK